MTLNAFSQSSAPSLYQIVSQGPLLLLNLKKRTILTQKKILRKFCSWMDTLHLP